MKNLNPQQAAYLNGFDDGINSQYRWYEGGNDVQYNLGYDDGAEELRRIEEAAGELIERRRAAALRREARAAKSR